MITGDRPSGNVRRAFSTEAGVVATAGANFVQHYRRPPGPFDFFVAGEFGIA